MSEILKAYKFRIYPDKEQQTKLNQTFGCVRVLWNHLVANFNAYGTDQYQEKYSEKEIKSNPDLFFLKEVSAASLQQKRMDFNAANNILVKGYSDITGLSIKESSAELVDYRRGEDVSLFDDSHHLATSLKRLDKFINLS